MKTENIPILESNKLGTSDKVSTAIASACCGGKPLKNETACCRLDEAKKAQGETGCGCGSGDKGTINTGCC